MSTLHLSTVKVIGDHDQREENYGINNHGGIGSIDIENSNSNHINNK